MRPKNIKDRCTKKKFSKCSGIALLYDEIQITYAEILEKDPSVDSFQVNVVLEENEIKDFTTDFFLQMTNGDMAVRECVFRKKLVLPRTIGLLDASYRYWKMCGITDWGIIVDRKATANETE